MGAFHKAGYTPKPDISDYTSHPFSSGSKRQSFRIYQFFQRILFVHICTYKIFWFSDVCPNDISTHNTGTHTDSSTQSYKAKRGIQSTNNFKPALVK